MTDLGDFPGGMPTYYRVHLEWVRHATETAESGEVFGDATAGVGATIEAFDAEFDPIGPRIREVLEPTFMIETPEGLLSLTDRGFAELAVNYGTKADSTFGNVSVTGTLVVTGAVTFSSTGSFAGPVTFPTNAVTGINPSGLDGIIIDGPTLSGAGISGRKLGLLRWRLVLGSNSAESGSNAGSDLGLNAYADNGTTLLSTPLSINRATGQATFSAGPVAPSFNINGAAGSPRSITGFTALSARWQMQLGSFDAESTGNAGSNFFLSRFNDAGALIDTPLTISRASGAATFNNNNLTLAGFGNVNFILNKVAGNNNQIFGQVGGVNRWNIQLGNNATEGGSNSGSDFQIIRCNDAGVNIDTPLAISRATGQVKFNISANTAICSPHIDGVSGTGRNLFGSTAGLDRWAIQLGNGLVESGSNVGSDLTILRYSDAGAFIDTPLTISRASGAVGLTGALNVAGILALTNQSVISGTVASGTRNLLFQTSGSTRWGLQIDGTAEGGSNAGSNMALNAYTDGGAGIGPVYSIVRSTRVVTFAAAIVNGPSDRTLKQNIEPITGALDMVQRLQGVSFNMIDDETKRRQIGFIAQDVAPVIPEVIQKYQPDAEAEPKLALDYPKLTALLIEALKEVTARLEAVEAKMAA